MWEALHIKSNNFLEKITREKKIHLKFWATGYAVLT